MIIKKIKIPMRQLCSRLPLLISALLITLMPCLAFATHLDLGAAFGAPGTDVTIPITLNYEGAAPNIAATSNDIGFDVARLENPRAAIGPAGTAASKDAIGNTVSPGVFRVAVFGLNQSIIQGGIVAFVTFRVTVGAGPGNIILSNLPSASNPTGGAVPVQGKIGSINIPAPSAFGDVSEAYWAKDYINTIFFEGITQGCSTNPQQYCPRDQVTREQMASFIVRAVDGADATVCAGFVFTDVPQGAPHCANIERLSTLNITQGCGIDLFCPLENVTRAEMASFLIRAVEGADASVCAGTLFNDVTAANLHCANIERLNSLAITQGCAPGMYCPSDNVLRDQMAAFLARAFLGME